MGSSVLIYGTDRGLLSTRRMVLEQTGLEVAVASEMVEVERLVRESAVHLLILCHTLRNDEREAAIAVVADAWPDAKSILLTKNYAAQDADRSRIVVNSATGPRGLLATVAQVLKAAPVA